MRATLCAAMLGALSLQGAAALAAEDALVQLSSTSARQQAAAIEELVAAGEKYIPEIEAAYAQSADDQRELRDRYREVVSRIRAEQVKKWALQTAPSLEKKLAWDLLQRNAAWMPKPATLADARRSLCRVSRLVQGWEEPEGVKLLKLCLEDQDAGVREAAVWALDRDGWNGPAIELLASALKDDVEKVRVSASVALIGHSDPRGLPAMLAGGLSKDPTVQELCTHALSNLIVSEDGQPQRLRFKHPPDDVVALIKLLTLEDVESRGTVVRLLGMIGDKSAGPALLAALGKESIAKNRRRIATSLAQLRHRPAAAALVELLKASEGKLRSGEEGKNNYAWGVASAWAQLGDPDSVPDMIALLGDPTQARYAASALSWAFGLAGTDQDYTRGDGPGEVLVPVLSSEGRLDRQLAAKAPKGEERQKLWEGFWAANKSKYKWSEEGSTLRYVIRPHPTVWSPPPLPGTRADGVPTGKKGEWVEIPITVQGQPRCLICGLAVDRTNGDVYIVPIHGEFMHLVGCSRGVWKSRDHGATFEKTGENDTGGGAGCWASMNMDPAGGRLAVFSMYGAVALTLDGGVSWRRLKSISEATTDWGDLDWSDPQAQTIMQTNHERSPGIHVSSDGGQTWQGLVPDRSYKTGLGVFDSRTILHIETNHIERSEDLGKTWTTVAKEGLKTIVLRKFKGVGYLIGDKGLLVSADKGKTWTVQGSAIDDPTVSAGPYFGRDENHIFIGGRRGIHESTDGGKTWTVTPLPEACMAKLREADSGKGSPIDVTIGCDSKADILYATVTGFRAVFRYQR